LSIAKLWSTSPEQLQDKHVQQVIAFSGSGKLNDSSDTSKEFRRFLTLIPSDYLIRYADESLGQKFEGNGFALQDVVNEVGRRLGFMVENGRYRGVQGQIGHDGLWKSPENISIVIEVKTTDAYRIKLNTIAKYRRELVENGHISEDRSSVLIVVGREDTGDLEAQIRGSRYAWSVRIISVDALLRLMKLKEATEDPLIHQQIRSILVPREFTKLDGIIDLVFSATEDIWEGDPSLEEEQKNSQESQTDDQKPKIISAPAAFNDACTERIQKHFGCSLIKQSRTTFASPDGETVLVCAVSKEHKSSLYWFAFHPYQQEALAKAAKSYVAFGCGSEKTIILIPLERFVLWLDSMWITEQKDRFYWHVKIRREEDRFTLDLKKGYDAIDLTPYLLT